VTSLSDFSLFFRELRHVDGIKCAGRWTFTRRSGSGKGVALPSHGENSGSSPLGSATSFAQSFTFKILVTCLCKKDAVFV